MAKRKKTFSETHLNKIRRFQKQQETMSRIESYYKTHTLRYYAKTKRHDILGNSFNVFKGLNPYELTPTNLNKVLKTNAQTLRSLGLNTKITGDYAEAMVLTILNNDAYSVINWWDNSPDEFESEYEALERQENVMGQILYNDLRNLRLTDYQLNRVLEASELPEDVKEEVKQSLINYWKKLRK